MMPKNRYIGFRFGIENNIGLLTIKAQMEKIKDVKKLKGTTTRVIININGIKMISPALELFDNESWGSKTPNK